MSTTDIVEAAFQKLETFVCVPQPVIFYPGLESNPPQSGMWLEAKVFPNEPGNIAWDNDSCVDTRGFFQVLVYFRPGQGVLEPGRLADALIDFFPKGSDLGPVRVRKRPWQSPIVTEDSSKLFIPVTIPYMGLT
jgi:hypothetical protein